jgi:hypothetical protein
VVHVWSTCQGSRTVRNGLQRSPAVGRSRRLQARSCGNRLRGRTLIRMRSQVQVLAGPPPIVAGQSTAGSEPGTLTAGLGRAGAARPSPPAPPLAPPGPPTRASGSATTTHRGRAPARGRQPRGGCRHPRAAACFCAHRAAARVGRSERRPGLPGRSAGKRGRRGPHPPRRPGTATDLPRPTRRGQRRPRPASWTVHRAVDGPAATGASTGSGGQGRPASSTWSPAPAPEHGRRRTRPDRRGRHQTAGHQTGGQQTAGQQTGGQQTAGQQTGGQRTVDRRTRWTTIPGDRTPDGWTAGCLDANTRMGGPRLLDSDDRRRGWPAGRVDHGGDARALDTGWTLLRADVVWAGNNQDRSAARTPRAPRCHRRASPRRDSSGRWYAAVQLAPRRTALLDHFGPSVERAAKLHPLWRGLVCLSGVRRSTSVEDMGGRL